MKGFEFPDVPEFEEEKQVVELDSTNSDNYSSPYEDDFDPSTVSPVEINTDEININPYEQTIINTNPYQNANIEEVISNENEEEVDNSSKAEEKVVENTNNEKTLSEDELTDLEIERIKTERELKLKNIRGIFVVFMFVVIVTVFVAYSRGDKAKEKVDIGSVNINLKDKDPKEDMEFSAELNNYYQTREKANIEKYLVDNADDSEKIAVINNTAVNQIEKLIEEIVNNSTSSIDYDNKMTDLKGYIKSLNDIRFNEASILKDIDYNTVNERIDHLKEISSTYFTGLNYYNAKDYNNACTTFSSITEDNYFYKAAKNHINSITEEIIAMLNNDITNLSTNLEYLDVAEQKEKYLQIKSIIEQYNKAYPYLNLETNQIYNDLLHKYTELSK